MARVGYGRHVKVVDINSFPDDDSYQVGTNEWNADISPKGMLGFTPTTSTTTISGGALLVTDSVCVVAAESGNSDDLDSITLTNTSEYDLIYLFADAGDTITLEHGGQNGALNVNGEVSTISGSPETLSETKPTILIRKGNYWYGYGGGSASNLDTTNLASGILDTDISSVAGTDTTIPSAKAVKTYVDAQTHEAGDITSVVAGSGLTGGGTSADVTLNVIGGTGITANADDIAIDSTVATLTGAQTFADKTLTSPVLNTGVSGSAILDEDNFASDSATKLATQQSIKAYIATQVSTGDITSVVAGAGLTGGATSGAATVNVVGGTGITANADDIAIDATVATLTGAQTLEDKTVDLGDNTVTGTIAEFNTALQSESFATLGGSETLVSKTLTSPVINVTSDATGDIYYRNGSGAFTRLPKPSTPAGEVLTFATSATAPSWVAASGGGLHEIQGFDLRTTGEVSGHSPASGEDAHMYVRAIGSDGNNDGLFIKIRKNGTALTEVQIA